MVLRIAACFFSIALAMPAAADPTDPANALLDALGLPEMVQIMREEGIDYGREMAIDLIPGGATDNWQSMVSEIYDTEAMLEMVETRFTQSFGDADTAPLLAFFDSDAGKQIVASELEARRAMIDNDVEAAARDAFRGLDGSSEPLLTTIETFVSSNDLIEGNVVGALNASYQFYLGLVDGGAFAMGEREILNEVWSQEEETRIDTREWLFAYLLMAYEPIDPSDLDRYVAMSQSEEGRAMNRALFDAMNAMYDDISYALGLAAAQEMMAQEL